MRASIVLCTLGWAVAAHAAPHRLPLEAVPERYEITLSPHLDSATFDGRARIALRVPKATSVVTLNAADLAITRAAVGDDVAEVQLDAKAQTATLHFAKPLPAGKARLELEWNGKLSDQLTGFYLAESGGKRFAFTDFEPTEARRAFPCFDEPAVKARFQMTARIDPAHRAVSNGAVVKETIDRAANVKVVEFAETPPLSTYLVALAVGPLEEVHALAGKTPVRVWTTPGKAALGKFALAEAQQQLAFYERYFGIPYAYGKLDLVAVPDFLAGAMENAGAIFFRETALLADAHAGVDFQRNVSKVVAHEIAHQWFGDLVTMAWWDDLWLNEAFATWAENRSLAAIHPSWEPWLEFQDWRERAMRQDALAATHPIKAQIDNPEEAHEAFDDITYAKGAAVLRMIELWLGEEPFRRGVDDYLRAHREANATGDDLWRALAAASKQPVLEVAKNWIERPGHPLVTATASCQNGKTELTLAQERDGKVAAGGETPWLLPLCAHTPDGTRCGLMKEARETRVVADRCVPWTEANAHAGGFFRVRYHGDGLGALEKAAEAKLTAEERFGLAADTWALVHDGKLPLTAYLELVASLRGETHSDVVMDVAGHLEQVGHQLVAAADQKAWQGYLGDVFGGTIEKLGWQPQAGESEEQHRLRAEVIKLLGTAGVGSVRQGAAARVGRYLEGSEALDGTLASAVVPVAAHNGDATRWQAYVARMRTAPTPEERERFMRALADFEAPALVERTLALTLTPDVRTQDTWRVLSELLRAPWSQRAAWAFVKGHMAELRKRIPADLMTRVVGATGSFCDAGLVDEARAFWGQQRLEGTARRAAMAGEEARACVDMKRREGASLAAWLRGRGQHAGAAGGDGGAR